MGRELRVTYSAVTFSGQGGRIKLDALCEIRLHVRGRLCVCVCIHALEFVP